MRLRDKDKLVTARSLCTKRWDRARHLQAPVGSIKNIPWSIDGFALCVLRRMKSLLNDGSVQLLDGDPIRCEVGTLIMGAQMA